MRRAGSVAVIAMVGAAVALVPISAGAAPAVGAATHHHQFPAQGSCDQPSGLCWTPGEPVLAVGPTVIVETTNEAATVYNKATGAPLISFDFATFWGSQTTSCTDPRALYLAASDRFAISCTDTTVEPTSPMRFAISKTGDPTGAWWQYAAPSGALDQDKIEATSDKFIIAGNNQGSEEDLYVYNLIDVVNGVASPAVVSLKTTKSNVYLAAVQQTPTSNGYFVSSYPGSGGVDLATVTGTPAAANVALTETLVSASDFPAPKEPAVPGGLLGGGAMDGRITSAIYEVESTTHKPVIQLSGNRECGTRTCSSSVRLDLSGASPVVSSNMLVGEPGWDYTYGAAGLDAAGHVFEVYSRSNPSNMPGVAVVGPSYDVTLQAAVAGKNSCNSSGCDERWGDYLGTAIDPSDPTAVWVSGLYQVDNGGFGWGTWIAKVSTGSFALPTATTGAASSVTASGASVAGTVNPNGVATTYHFDYGLTSGYDSATTETSAGSGTGAVPVSAVLTGLKGNTTYHYRVVATTTTGSAIGKDLTFKTPKPTITSVVFTGTAANPTVTITGTNFGSLPSATPAGCGATGSNYGATGLWFQDITQGKWTAGKSGDCIGLVVSTWTGTQIVFQFGSFYTGFGPVTNKDKYKLEVAGVTKSGIVTYS